MAVAGPRNAPPVAEYSEIAYEVSDGIGLVTLDRPERLNALTHRMVEELIDVVDRIDADDDVRVAIVTGRGRAFCAGADLEADALGRGGGRVTLRIYDSVKPFIAAINGPAVGFGATVTLPMDVRLCADTARIGFVFVRRGIVPESCSSWFLPRIVGIATAAEWVYSGRIFAAAEAHRAGLVRSLHPAGDLEAAARDLAGSLMADSAPVATALSRRLLWGMLAADGPRDAHELESRALHALAGGADVQEGVDAFLEKRDARFPLRVSTDLPRLGLE